MALLSCELEPSGAGGARLIGLVDVAFPCTLSCAGCARGRRHGVPNGAAVAAVAAQLADRAERDDVEHVAVVFFGGEPLLDVEAVAEASGCIRDACARAGRGYDAAIITTGTLLDALTAGRLARAGFTAAQLTLPANRGADGCCAVDVRRIARVVRNARAARGDLELLIRMEVSGAGELRAALALVRIFEQEGLLAMPRPASVLLGPATPYAVQARALLAHPSARRGTLASAIRAP